MATNPGFINHGLFIEGTPASSLGRYANYGGAAPAADLNTLIARFVQATKDMKASSVWLQLFNRHGQIDNGAGGTRELVAALNAAGITPIGWGYCHSKNFATDGGLATRCCSTYGINGFVADVEPGNKLSDGPDTWQPNDFVSLIKGLNTQLGKDNLGISTFSRLDLNPELKKIMPLAVNLVSMYAPQVYWNFRDPVDFTEKAISSWRSAGIGAPLVITAQSYWDRTDQQQPETPPQSTVETKLGSFITALPATDWSKFIGLNWYHAGKSENSELEGAMSDIMIKSIIQGRLDQKPYQRI
jgi:hypothetical protein